MANRVKYLIQVLDSKSFDELPYKYTDRAFGVTDTNEKKIYVRNMGNIAINHNIIEHEIEEASGFDFNHEFEDEIGIKYGLWKKVKKFFRKAVPKEIKPFLPLIVGGLTGGLGLGVLGLGSTMTGALAGGLTGGVLAGGKPKEWALPAATGALMGGVGAKVGAGAVKGATAAKAGFLSKAGGAISGAGEALGLPGFGAPATTAPTGSVLLPGSPAAGQITGQAIYGGAAPGAGYTAGGIGAGAGQVAAGLPSAGQIAAGPVAKKSLLKTMAGFALPMLGQGLIGTPEMPESAKVAELEGRMGPGGEVTEVGGLGLEKLTERLGTSWEGLSEEYKTAIKSDFDQPYEDAKENLIRQYKTLRPGADIAEDSAFRRDMMRLEQDFADRISNRMVQLEQQERTNYLNRQAEDIRTSLNLDEQTFNRYAELAQYDIDRIMLEAGISYGEAQSFKDIFSQFGSLLMQQGMGMG